jgi:putative endonuclease
MNILKVLTPKRRTGNFGEDAAAKFLKKNRYKILSRGYDDGEHEIDIIARKKDITVFVEVKTRNIASLSQNEPRPASSVTPKKQRAIISAAKHYLALNPQESQVRFDVIEVYVEGNGNKMRVKEIKHLENTFNRNTAYSNYKRG